MPGSLPMTAKTDTTVEVITISAAVADVRAPVLALVHVRAAAEQVVLLRIFTAQSSKAKEYATDFGEEQLRNDQSEII